MYIAAEEWLKLLNCYYYCFYGRNIKLLKLRNKVHHSYICSLFSEFVQLICYIVMETGMACTTDIFFLKILTTAFFSYWKLIQLELWQAMRYKSSINTHNYLHLHVRNVSVACYLYVTCMLLVCK